MKALNYFILAGGYGQRARPLTYFKPKPVFPLDGTPLIRIMLKQLKEKGLREGFINLHYMPGSIRECIEKMGMEEKPGVTYIYEEELTGSKVLRSAAQGMDEEGMLLVINGDMYLELPVEEMVTQSINDDAEGIILARPNKERNPGFKEILTKGDIFTGRREHKGEPVDPESLMYTGAAIFKKKVIDEIQDINIFDTLERNRSRIKVYRYEGIWLDIGTSQSYRESNFEYKKYINSGGSNSLSENVKISGDSEVEGSIIWEGTEIKNGSRVKNCIIAGGMELNNAHYENQIITRDHLKKTLAINANFF